jgi:TolB-like protein/Tfp pilus assembly protein PilF
VRLVNVFERATREVVARYGGRIVKFMGDGVLTEFPSTDLAVRSAYALQRSFTVAMKAQGLGDQALRIGVHVGDVAATQEGDLLGDGVNIASRIQGAGEPGDVWVSDDVRRQLQQRPEFRFESRGERELKGLKRRLEVHAVHVLDHGKWTPPSLKPTGDAAIPAEPATREPPRRWDKRRVVSYIGLGGLIVLFSLGAVDWWQGRTSDDVESGPTLAVLPFENLSNDSSTEPFVRGIHDDLLTALSRTRSLKVVSRTSVMGYQGTTKTLPQIAEELGASVILEGGIQRSGNRIRMNVQLIDTRTAEQLWAERFDRTLTAENVFAIQGEIAERISDALRTALTAEEKSRLGHLPTANLHALDLYYQGIDFYSNRIENMDARSAELAFARATDADPSFAAAWAGLAQARSWLIRWGMETDTTSARQALDRAVALAPGERETALAQGVYYYYAKGDFQTSADHFESALRSWPEDAELLNYRSLVLRRLGRWEEALDGQELAHQIDPRNPSILIDLAETLQFLRRYEEAELYFDQVLALLTPPETGRIRARKFELLLLGRGDTLSARRLLEAWIDPVNKLAYASYAARLAFFERDYSAGVAALESTLAERSFPVLAPFQLAILWRWAGQEETSLAWSDSLYFAADMMIEQFRSSQVDPFGSEAELTSYRGLAHALSGRFVEAVRDGRRGTEMLPYVKDAVEANEVLDNLATIYILVGNRDAALAVVDTLVSRPSVQVGAGRLRLDPTYDTLRGDPRFDGLIHKAEVAERTGTGTR